MTNFIFKSQGLIKNVDNKLGIILAELRHQRSDNVQILFLLNKMLVNKALQKQVDEYFEEGEEHGIPDTRTSPQTEIEDKSDLD